MTNTIEIQEDVQSDDIWSESDGQDRSTNDAEWTRMSEEFTNAGYREGLSISKEGALQAGFDEGFVNVGAPSGRQLGNLRGMISALLAIVKSERYTNLSKSFQTDINNKLHIMLQNLHEVRLRDFAAVLPSPMDGIDIPKPSNDKDGLSSSSEKGMDEESLQDKLDGIRKQLEAIAQQLRNTEAL